MHKLKLAGFAGASVFSATAGALFYLLSISKVPVDPVAALHTQPIQELLLVLGLDVVFLVLALNNFNFAFKLHNSSKPSVSSHCGSSGASNSGLGYRILYPGTKILGNKIVINGKPFSQPTVDILFSEAALCYDPVVIDESVAPDKPKEEKVKSPAKPKKVRVKKEEKNNGHFFTQVS